MMHVRKPLKNGLVKLALFLMTSYTIEVPEGQKYVARDRTVKVQQSSRYVIESFSYEWETLTVTAGISNTILIPGYDTAWYVSHSY